MCELVIEDTAGLVIEAKRVVSGEATLNPVRRVADADIVAAAVLLADAVVVLDGIYDAFQARHIRVFRSPIEGLQNAECILLNVGSGIGDDVVVNPGTFREGSFIVEFNVSGIVAFPFLLHLDGSMVLGCLVDGLSLTADCESGCNDECECTFHFVILNY